MKAEYFTCCTCSSKSVLPSKTSLAHPQINHHPSVLSNPQQHSQIFPIQLKIALYTFMPDLYCDFAKSQLPKVGAKFLPAVNFNLILILHSLQFLSLPWLRKAYKETTSEFFLTFNEDYIQSLILTEYLPTTPYPMVQVRCYTPNCPSAHRLSPEMLNVNQNHTRPAGWAPTLHHLLAAHLLHFTCIRSQTPARHPEASNHGEDMKGHRETEPCHCVYLTWLSIKDQEDLREWRKRIYFLTTGARALT